MTTNSDELDEELITIMGAVYMGAVIDSNNGDVKKFDQIPKDSRVLNAVNELRQLIDRASLEARLIELDLFEQAYNSDQYWDTGVGDALFEGKRYKLDRLKDLEKRLDTTKKKGDSNG